MLVGIYTEAADASVFGKIERDKRLYDLKSLFGLRFKGFYKKTRARVSVFPIYNIHGGRICYAVIFKFGAITAKNLRPTPARTPAAAGNCIVWSGGFCVRPHFIYFNIIIPQIGSTATNFYKCIGADILFIII